MFSKLKPSSGSPPHTRGKGTLETQEKHMDRITPAHAGKRCAFPNVWEDVKDHPRTRGEKSAVKEAVAPVAGITPAHAGKRNRQCNLQVCRWDHPRTRGEKGNIPEKFNSLLGSPPHTRGKDIYILAISFHSRITPAHAGKRRWGCSLRRPPRDHPRTRGEKGLSGPNLPAGGGSPPHTRGKDFDAQIGRREEGITPAHAGKRMIISWNGVYYKDHPRTRGEKLNLQQQNLANQGSPPHTRGKAHVFPRGKLWHRITPAHAGKRSVSSLISKLRKDHPRTRGEKPVALRYIGRHIGSPPHTRGKEEIRLMIEPTPGITPAHAGKRDALWRCSPLGWDHPRTRGEKSTYSKK